LYGPHTGKVRWKEPERGVGIDMDKIKLDGVSLSKRSEMKNRVFSAPARAVAAGVLSGFLLLLHGTATGDAAAGARLAAVRCVPCHSSNETIHSMLPLLEGQPKTGFIAQWRAFRERKRTAPAMVSLAEELSEQDVQNLAEHYAALLPPRASESLGSDSGRALAERLRCADCHGPALQGTSAGAARLAGQRARYTVWSLQLMRGGTRAHGTAAKPDPLLANLSNAEIEALAGYLASLR
jgi:cytochrome c553